jgi:5-methyltetrahydrofolate--homocysteine methyltransferase
MMGVSPEEIVRSVKEAGADIIGANCGMGFEQMIEIVQAIRDVDPLTPVLVHANAGMPVIQNAKTVFPETPETMAARVKDLIDPGANIIGDCCGTTPDHIRAFVSVVRGD